MLNTGIYVLKSNLSSSISAFSLIFLMITMSQVGLIDFEETVSKVDELENEAVPLFATSPGHTVFGEYVGAHWCGPCMSSASPSLNNLKTSNPDDFTYVSFFEGSGTGWPSDSIGSSGSRSADHVMAASSGYPTFSFADEQAGSCYKVGAGGTNFYDSDYSSGGCMAPSSSDFTMELSTSLDSSGETVTTDLTVTYLGSLPSVIVYVYAAVTEHSGAENYDDGYKPHHVFKSWLLNSNDNGFEQLVLSPGSPSELSWDEPLSSVRAADGRTQFENFWPVVALMDGPHSSYNNIYAAIDLDMAPLVDIGISDFIIEGTSGFVQGDNLVLSSTIQNNGVDSYSDGGDISIYYLGGSEEQYLGEISINTLSPGSTQDFSVNFDTSSVEMQPSGTSVFRARLSDLDGDRIASNNYADVSALHDLPPTPNTPTAVSSPNVNRGSIIQFEVSAISNDLVDTMDSMYPTLQYSESGSGSWDDTWIAGSEMIGNGGNSRYQYSINTELNSPVGPYDIRIMWTDAGGQSSQWLESNDAFHLQNAIPIIYSSSNNEYSGMPTVKVDSNEEVSIIGLINDAETPLQLLDITSDAEEFISWDPLNLKITVKFSQVIRDSHGNPLPQGIYVNVDDGDDINSGLILFNVIENGAPRWSPINTQSFDEGGYGSITFTNYLSDTDDNGNPVPVAGLSLSLLGISDETLVEATLNGHSLSLTSLDENSFGIVDVTIRASDGMKYSDTVVTFHVLNVNDAPNIDLTGIEEITLQTGDVLNLELLGRITDIDNSDDEIWTVVTNEVSGATQWNPISGILVMSWQEAGIQTVSITAEDRYGASSTSIIQVNIFDELPLSWRLGSQGDLTISIDTTEHYSNPSVTISNVGELVLSEISVFWGICNSVTGICHSSGISHNLGPFIVNHINGEGLGSGDYITFTVRAVDQDGMDRSTDETYKVYATLPVVIVDDEPTVKAPSSNGMSPLKISLIGLGLLSLLCAILVVNVVLRRRIKSVEVNDLPMPIQHQYQQETMYSESRERSPPPPPMMAQLPPGGLPDGWTIEQWHYYGEEYLRRIN